MSTTPIFTGGSYYAHHGALFPLTSNALGYFFLPQLCFRILAQEKKVPAEEFNFFLYGGVVVDRYVRQS